MMFCVLRLLVVLSFASPFATAQMGQAERLIRGLNLFPTKDVNIVKAGNHDSVAAKKIVEKSFRFPSTGGVITLDTNGSSVEDFSHHAGYYSLPHTKGARMFYYFFESRTKAKDAPVVVWLTGGPGCSGSLALFFENGPFYLTEGLSLAWNDFGWDKVSNLIYVDQPTGTGFSYSTDMEDIRNTSEEAGADFYDFLQAFFEKHPVYAKNDFYITGESYAGHYIPAFATQIHQKNKNKQGIHINLKGLAIGNGMTNPEIQFAAYPDYALDMKLINKSQYDELKPLVSTCEGEAKSCGSKNASACMTAYDDCNSIFDDIISVTDNINYYDIRKKCIGSLCYDLSSVDKFLNQPSVKTALGVEPDIQFVSCSTEVYQAMKGDWMNNFAVGIPALLEDGIKLLVYAGEYDLICNWLGNSRWVNDTKWSGQRSFLSTPSSPFTVDKKDYGLQKSHGPLTFLKVYNAGHMVPMDQPKASLEMIARWTQGKPL